MTGELTMFTALYATIYDRITSGSERAGLGEERRGLLAIRS